MGKISNEDRDVNALKLVVSLWQDSDFGVTEDSGWLFYSDIAKRAKDFNKRTLSRYLNWLVKEGKLEVMKNSPRTRRFRPTMWYWKKTFKWIRNDDLIDKEQLDAADAEYLYFIELAGQISEIFDKACLLDITVEQRARKNDAKGLSRKQLNELNAKISTLIRAIRLDLSREYFNHEKKPEATYALLRGVVRRAVLAYLDLWLFITKTYGARKEFAKQMLTVQRKVSALKRAI
jgi:hypothetical protein